MSGQSRTAGLRRGQRSRREQQNSPSNASTVQDTAILYQRPLINPFTVSTPRRTRIQTPSIAAVLRRSPRLSAINQRVTTTEDVDPSLNLPPLTRQHAPRQQRYLSQSGQPDTLDLDEFKDTTCGLGEAVDERDKQNGHEQHSQNLAGWSMSHEAVHQPLPYRQSYVLEEDADVGGGVESVVPDVVHQAIEETAGSTSSTTSIRARIPFLMKRKPADAFGQDKDKEGDEDEVEGAQDSEQQSLFDGRQSSIFKRMAQARIRDTRQDQHKQASDASTLSNVLLSSASSSASLQETPRNESLNFNRHSLAGPSRWHPRSAYPSTPTARGRGELNADEEPPSLWSAAGRRAVMQLKHGVYTDDGQEASQRGHTTDASAEAGYTRPDTQPESSHRMRLQMRGASHSEEDGQAVYRKRGLGGELDTSQSNVSPNSNMTVGQTDTVTMAQEDRAHAIEVSAHVDSHQSNSNNTINNNRLDNVDDDTAEELTLMEERVQQSVQKLMASSGKSEANWSSSTSAGRISRDGRPSRSFLYKRVGESSVSSLSSLAIRNDSPQQQREKITAEEAAGVDQGMQLGVSDERDQAQQQRQGHEYGREQSVEEEVNVDSEEAIIRRKLEAEMEAELLDYEESLFDEVVQRAAEEQPSDTLLEELAGDYVGPLTTLDELEERSWMYETPRIARLERVFASRW